MQLQTVEFEFTLLTPCFSGTALGRHADQAEMRIPPIRGHARFWHRALFGAENCNHVWGSTSGKNGQGSLVALRFIGSVSDAHAKPEPAVLPHKAELQQRGQRPAIAPGNRFTLQLQRLPGCTEDDWDRAQRAIKTWLLLGGLGLRANRAAGSVWPIGHWVPKTAEDLRTVLQQLGLRDWSVAIIGLGKQKTEAELRETASDTIQGNPYAEIFGGIKPRKPSPTKFKVSLLAAERGQEPAPCLIAVAPDKQVKINGLLKPILHHAESLLKTKPNAVRWRALEEWHYLLP